MSNFKSANNDANGFIGSEKEKKIDKQKTSKTKRDGGYSEFNC